MVASEHIYSTLNKQKDYINLHLVTKGAKFPLFLCLQSQQGGSDAHRANAALHSLEELRRKMRILVAAFCWAPAAPVITLAVFVSYFKAGSSVGIPKSPA